MSSSSLQSQLLALLRFDRAQLLEVRTAADGPAPQLTPGQRVEAQVESRAPDNRALLRIEGALVQTKLPDSVSAQVGQRVALTVLKTEPVLTLLVQPDADGAPPGAVRVNVSDVASRISQLVSNKPDDAAKLVTTIAPLLAAPPGKSADLLLPLRSAIESSGLFYESHQAQWVKGERSKESLQTEPQGKWLPAKDALPQTSRVTLERSPDSVTPALKESSAATTTTVTSKTAGTGDTNALPLTAQSSGAMLERQINTLVSHTAVWQGQLWPGQEMQWELEERLPQSAVGTEATQWRSRIKLELPRLGTVEAILELSGDALRVQITSNETSASVFAQERAPLQDALAARGLELQALQVDPHDETA